MRHGESRHLGAAPFQRDDFEWHALHHLAQRHQHNVDLTNLIAKIRARPSAREADKCSLTLTQASQPQLPHDEERGARTATLAFGKASASR